MYINIRVLQSIKICLREVGSGSGEREFANFCDKTFLKFFATKKDIDVALLVEISLKAKSL